MVFTKQLTLAGSSAEISDSRRSRPHRTATAAHEDGDSADNFGFRASCENAMDVGFDGVQILANYLYLIAQFLNPRPIFGPTNTAAAGRIGRAFSSRPLRR